MNRLTLAKNAVTSKVGRQILLGRKHSPQILFVVGTAAVITGTVLACRATLKVRGVLEAHDEKIAQLDLLEEASFKSDTKQNVINKQKIKTGLELAKLYAVPAVVTGAGIAALTGSHVILTKRNSGLAATVTALNGAYNKYRERVAKEYGDEVDQRIAAGVETTLIEEKLSDGTTKTSSVNTTDEKEGRYGGSIYARPFYEMSKHYSREPGMNSMFLSVTQSWANDKLRAQGHLFLNEVYDMLDIPRSKEGQIVGWVYSHDSDKQKGDDYVSFKIFEVNDPEKTAAFLEGREGRIVLDFNVAGAVLDMI